MAERMLASVSSARGEWRRWAPHLAAALAEREPTLDAADVIARAEERFGELLTMAPDPGWRAPSMRAFSTGGAIYVAVYLVLAERGCDAARAWAVCDGGTRRRFAAMKGLERTAASSGMFSWPMRWLVRSLEARSKDAPLAGWAARAVDEPGFDLGVDYTTCAIRDLAIRAGAADFAPYICLADVIGSDELGWGLVRTETLAQGGSRCDFRFKKGGPTDVKVRLPIAPK